ncbi:MAG: hypothetical protein KDD69_00640 [Bdellovibrionales bacterium]|nr:hypothetical protein [Bdellovibrionales bacterium]
MGFAITALFLVLIVLAGFGFSMRNTRKRKQAVHTGDIEGVHESSASK